MILRILVLTCAIFVTPSFGGMTLSEFSRRFEDMCFQNEPTDPFRINGQETPLSSTLENFIALAEKLEAANPMMLLKDELFYFIRNYIFENIRLTDKGVSQWKSSGLVFTEIENLWEPDDNIRSRRISVQEPFTDDEKCSLYYMISHSIVDKPKDPQAFRSAVNSSTSRVSRADLNPSDYYPQEIGVVAIRGSDVAVSLSRVLVGMYVGMDENRRKDLSSFKRTENFPETELPQERTVDTLYTLTLAEVLMMSKWVFSSRRGLAPNGKWVSIPLGYDDRIDGFCPMVYKQQDEQIAYSYSSVRGAADGLILGMIVNPIIRKKSNTKLSEILRMYYSRDGIPVEQDTEGIFESRVSFCERREAVALLETSLETQMKLFGYLTAEKAKDIENTLISAKNEYEKLKQDIYDITDMQLVQYCKVPPSMDRPEDLPKQTFLDVFVVLDSSISEDAFQQQQKIAGYLAKNLDLRYTGSRMTILKDQRIISDRSSSGKIELKPVVADTFSSSCAACAVGQVVYEHSSLERDQIIVALNQLLAERKDNETNLNGANGKVVVYFNFENDMPSRDNSKIQGRLDRALRELYLNHPDTIFIAVGLNIDVLKKFARMDPSFVILAADGPDSEVGTKLYEKISTAPALLQYSDCSEARSESSAVYENFVTPMNLQHFEMPAKYFYKSRNLKIVFESLNGVIKVCHNRATMKPENEARNCLNTSVANRVEFKVSNPCQSFTKETCSPFYFAVMGVKNSREISTDNRLRDYCTDINDHWCGTLDAIKYKVLHEGIRCSGCVGLGAPPAVILLTILLTYFLYKNF